ncbi:hypothetical protein N8703_00915 [Verrucomicrobia bacterium]|nr:hypothetical protein [Verrucomicrobiota bacterium]
MHQSTQIKSSRRHFLARARTHARQCWHTAFETMDMGCIEKAWTALEDAVAGKNPHFEVLDAPYHDLEHTLRASACYADLVRKNQSLNAVPTLTPEIAELGFIAILFHDTGYLKERGDHVGTGAKHASYHVQRSQHFAQAWMKAECMDSKSAREVENMISCTDFIVSPQKKLFPSEQHYITACMVGTADLLGQMAAPDYIEKLPLLHEEMKEAQNHLRGTHPPLNLPETPGDLIRQTPAFYEKIIKPKLFHAYAGVVRLLNDPYPDGPNAYLNQIKVHLDLIANTLEE